MKVNVPLLVILLFSAGLAQADDSAPPRATVESLPPGLWFRGGHYEDFALEEEPAAPTVAVIAGRFAGARAAERAAGRMDRTSVGLGYPWVVANHDLRVTGDCHDAIVVVAGLFATREQARAWQAADRARRSFRIVALDPEDGTSCASLTRRLELTYVEPTRDAPGYRVADLARLDATGPITIAALPVHCTVPRGSVHTFGARDVIAPFDLDYTIYRFGWRFAPARCDGELVYVPVEHTMRSTLIETHDGATRLLQITDVSCDAPNWDVWSYSRDGREEIEGEAPTFTAACAG